MSSYNTLMLRVAQRAKFEGWTQKQQDRWVRQVGMGWNFPLVFQNPDELREVCKKYAVDFDIIFDLIELREDGRASTYCGAIASAGFEGEAYRLCEYSMWKQGETARPPAAVFDWLFPEVDEWGVEE